MRQCTLLIVLLFMGIIGLNGQMSIGGEPYSFNNTMKIKDSNLAASEIAKPDFLSLKSEDEEDAKSGNPLRYSVLEKSNLTLENAGQWEELKNGDRVWKLKIQAKDAKAISLLYDAFYMPAGASFYIYSEDKTAVLGAFTSLNNKETGQFATGNVMGGSSILEYYEPASVKGQGIISINNVGFVYRLPQSSNFKNSDPCEVDVNCSEGNNWQDEKKGVVRISIVSGGGQYWCTGSLINNTAQDCKPYILTALHCGEGSSANEFNQYIFYFNYESANCGSGAAPTNKSVTGATKRADSGDGGGNSGSDFLLVELNNSIPDAYNAYFNGWNAANSPSTSGVGIHHPAGDRKKISTYNTSLSNGAWGSASGSHWDVQWISTPNGHGVTEGGSSGSPLFNNAGLIVGQLTGGGSYCNTPTVKDSYGKMSYNWSSNPGDNLKDLLDPTNSGQLQLSGSYDPCSTTPQPTCNDGVQNGNETGVDCGGNCSSCTPTPTCNDGVQNGTETGVDCGGNCTPCTPTPTCNDGVQNGTETGVDCGGNCSPCTPTPPTGCTVNPNLSNQSCVAQVQAEDAYCCETGWDGICQQAYDECVSAGSDNGCSVTVNLSNQDFVDEVQAADDYCCESDWDGICQQAYDDLLDAEDACEAPSEYWVSHVKKTSVRVNWDAVTDAVKYRVRYRPYGVGASWKAKNANITKRVLKPLFQGTEYEYQVRTKCPDGWTAWGEKYYFYTAGYASTPITQIVEQEATMDVSLYPNPTTGILNLDTQNLVGEITIRVVSYDGKELIVRQENIGENAKLRLDLSEQTDGLYLVTIQSADEIITKRVMLVRR